MTAPQSIGVIGAGMVGLSTAWFLQERGAEVTVIDAVGPAAGASWGNAGWITPTLSTPLTDPSMLTYGLRQLTKPTSPLYVPPTRDLPLYGFLARMARNSTPRRWRSGVRKLAALNRQALDAFDDLARGGVDGPISDADEFVFGYTDPAGPQAMVEEGRRISSLGQPVDLEVISVEEARAGAPILSDDIRGALRLHGQRFIDPPAFVAALAESVMSRAGALMKAEVARVEDRGNRVRVRGPGVDERFDAVVIASGVTLTELAAPFGVRTRMRAGRGYSFAVDVDQMPLGPVYFPGSSVVCTPLADRMRIAGMMEFRPHDAPLDERRIEAIVKSVRPLLQGVDLDDRHDEWVGSRPCTEDGLPLVGATESPRVFVAGGHAMEGMTLGPATGRLLARAVVTGSVPAELRGFDPLR
ncbi:NAD(P)/FAD-dependent oxidoreductase [Gordonia neofelifaecis]|uniref:D-amino-acid dehydrogenase n=1 Tax=Gordonia neofelifaecis NRRL B-59395 TaxID=644548 RepID=F1YJ23_9ACTN|nr:FAD-dependent oxidoreductase [Gordonia neofelifaecis]EGD55481.1 D-amino-acid dehydrogenase [Gordonia neofelifaecis NRRL B-59395]